MFIILRDNKLFCVIKKTNQFISWRFIEESAGVTLSGEHYRPYMSLSEEETSIRASKLNRIYNGQVSYRMATEEELQQITIQILKNVWHQAQ